MDKLELIIDKIDYNQKHVEHRLDRIDANLSEHMRRTDVLEKLHIDNQDRILKLEEPKKALKLLKSWVIGIGSVAGAAYAVARVMNWL